MDESLMRILPTAEAFQRYDLVTCAEGRIKGVCSTNDDQDLGVPNDAASWSVDYPSYEAMLRETGGCHRGVSGVRVDVLLDGRLVRLT